MHIIIVLAAVTYSFLFAAESPKDRLPENGSWNAKTDNANILHENIYKIMRRAQRERYSIAAVKSYVTEFEKSDIKTGYHYTILTNEETEPDLSKQRIMCFRMDTNDHNQPQFVIQPLRKDGIN